MLHKCFYRVVRIQKSTLAWRYTKMAEVRKIEAGLYDTGLVVPASILREAGMNKYSNQPNVRIYMGEDGAILARNLSDAASIAATKERCKKKAKLKRAKITKLVTEKATRLAKHGEKKKQILMARRAMYAAKIAEIDKKAEKA